MHMATSSIALLSSRYRYLQMDAGLCLMLLRCIFETPVNWTLTVSSSGHSCQMIRMAAPNKLDSVTALINVSASSA
jgi:hypothetical protein